MSGLEKWQEEIIEFFLAKGLPSEKKQELEQALNELWDLNVKDLRRKAIDRLSVEASSRPGMAARFASLASWGVYTLLGVSAYKAELMTCWSSLYYVGTYWMGEEKTISAESIPCNINKHSFESLFAALSVSKGVSISAEEMLEYLQKQVKIYRTGVEDAESINPILKGAVSVVIMYGLQSLLQEYNFFFGMAAIALQKIIVKKIGMNTEEHPMQSGINLVKQYLDEQRPPSKYERVMRWIR
jgi:hypothetical protein